MVAPRTQPSWTVLVTGAFCVVDVVVLVVVFRRDRAIERERDGHTWGVEERDGEKRQTAIRTCGERERVRESKR